MRDLGAGDSTTAMFIRCYTGTRDEGHCRHPANFNIKLLPRQVMSGSIGTRTEFRQINLLTAVA